MPSSSRCSSRGLPSRESPRAVRAPTLNSSKHPVSSPASAPLPGYPPERRRSGGHEEVAAVGRRIGTALVVVLASYASLAYLAMDARAATTSFDRSRTILFNNHPTFPLVLSPGPALGVTTPWGTDGLTETAATGINVYRTGTGQPWPAGDTSLGLAWGRAPAAHHGYPCPHRAAHSQALPGPARAA